MSMIGSFLFPVLHVFNPFIPLYNSYLILCIILPLKEVPLEFTHAEVHGSKH